MRNNAMGPTDYLTPFVEVSRAMCDGADRFAVLLAPHPVLF